MDKAANESFVTYELDGDVALIGLNRPAKRNAISDVFVEASADAVQRAEGEARRRAAAVGERPYWDLR